MRRITWLTLLAAGLVACENPIERGRERQRDHQHGRQPGGYCEQSY